MGVGHRFAETVDRRIPDPITPGTVPGTVPPEVLTATSSTYFKEIVTLAYSNK